MSQTAILMYHRVCERTPLTRCYFERGTAIEPAVFEHQIKWLARHHRVVSLADWWERKDEPGKDLALDVVLTFDDGYAECAGTVQSICARAGMRFSVFAVAEHTGESAWPTWVDAYYGVLHTATLRDGLGSVELSNRTFKNVPNLDEGLQWWVKGPIKEMLHGLSRTRQREALNDLRTQLRSDVDFSTLAAGLYATRSQLKCMYRNGVEIGGHGKYHLRLSSLSKVEQQEEIAASWALLDALGVEGDRFFCYPDGRFEEETKMLVEQTGFVGAMTVEPGMATNVDDSMELPRFIVRNRRPVERGWCLAFTGSNTKT